MNHFLSRETNPDRIRILLNVDCLWLGGLEKKVAILALGLDRRRFEPVVAWSYSWGPVGDQLRDAGIPVVKLNFRGVSSEPSPQEIIRQVQPDIFHSFSCKKSNADVQSASEARVPAIITGRGDMRFWDDQSQVRSWEVERNRATHLITACCEAVAESCVSIEGVPRDKINVVHNGVTLPDAAPGKATVREDLCLGRSTELIGYLARYRAVKGHAMLLSAFEQVLARRPRAHLVCCGDDFDGTQEKLRDLIAQRDFAKNVSILDSRTEVSRVYQGLDVYVHPSLSEGFSNSILEAMAHGLPVVATSVGGMPEAVLHGITGTLVPPGDSTALADAIVALLENEDRRSALGRAGRERVREHFSIRSMISGYERVYESAVFKHRLQIDIPESRCFMTRIRNSV